MAVPQNARRFHTVLGELVKQCVFAGKAGMIGFCSGTVITVPYIPYRSQVFFLIFFHKNIAIYLVIWYK